MRGCVKLVTLLLVLLNFNIPIVQLVGSLNGAQQTTLDYSYDLREAYDNLSSELSHAKEEVMNAKHLVGLDLPSNEGSLERIERLRHSAWKERSREWMSAAHDLEDALKELNARDHQVSFRSL